MGAEKLADSFNLSAGLSGIILAQYLSIQIIYPIVYTLDDLMLDKKCKNKITISRAKELYKSYLREFV